jgi:hypothetical protein
MSERQIVLVIASFAILALATLAAQFKWLPEDSAVQRVVFLLAGIGVVASLFAAGLPPRWFDGSKSAFGLAAMLTIGAFVGRAGQSFRLPLLLGMGGTLLVVNFMAHL